MARAIIPYPESPGFDTPAAAVRRSLLPGKSLVVGDEGRLACGADSELFRRGAGRRADELAVMRRGFRRSAGHEIDTVRVFAVPLLTLPGTTSRVPGENAAALVDDRVVPHQADEAVELRP
jgi:hypothetical protein